MALGAAILVEPYNPGPAQFTKCCRSRWYNAIDAGGPATADGAPVTIPSTEIILATRKVLQAPDAAKAVLLRYGYDDGATPDQDPVVRLFGLEDVLITSSPVPLVTSDGTEDCELVTGGGADVSDGTLCYTDVILANHRFDLLGCPFLVVYVYTAATVSAGILTNSVIQVRFID